jgi:hypothetical protein
VHDVAQKTYDDIAALVASFLAETQTRTEKLLVDMRAVAAASDAVILARVRSWKGRTTPNLRRRAA